jgi:hypothetical protein
MELDWKACSSKILADDSKEINQLTLNLFIFFWVMLRILFSSSKPPDTLPMFSSSR